MQSTNTSLFFILVFNSSNILIFSPFISKVLQDIFIAFSISKLVFEHGVIFSILPTTNTFTSFPLAFNCLAIPRPSPPLFPTPLTTIYLSYKSISKCLIADNMAFSIITIRGILYSLTQTSSSLLVDIEVPILIYITS